MFKISKRGRMKNDDDEEGLFVDRISGLPEPIIHHIMSHQTPKDVARIPTLSKRFNSLWKSFPIIVFDHTLFLRQSSDSGCSPARLEHIFRPEDTHSFLRYAARSIQLRQLNTDLERFSLKLQLRDKIYDISRAYSLIHFALENRVKELDLHIRKHSRFRILGGESYRLMEGFSSKSVTVLKLNGIKFDLNEIISACPSIKSLDLKSCIVSEYHTINNTSCSCQSLRMLSFTDVNVTEKWVEHNISSFENLEILLIRECRELTNIRVSNNKLETMDVVGLEDGPILESLEVVAPELRCLYLTAAACITDEWIKELIVNLSYIHTLKLKKCARLKRIEICNDRLQSLKLLECPISDEVIIHAPKLHSFTYKGKLPTFSMVNTSSLRNCKLSFNPTSSPVNLDRWDMLRDALSFFGIGKALTLVCHSQKDLIFPEAVKDSRLAPLYDLKHMEIVGPWETIGVSLVDNFLWLAPHLETLCFVLKSKEKVTIKMHHKKDIAQDLKLVCNSNRPTKCWWHHLERVEIQSLESTGYEKELLEYFVQGA